MKYLTLLVMLLLTAGACYLLGSYISKLLAKKQYRRRKKERSMSKFPLSAFSVLNHPAASIGKEQFTAEREAEVYLAYGKKKEAQQVLDMAMKKGQISAAEVEAFWASRDPAKG